MKKLFFKLSVMTAFLLANTQTMALVVPTGSKYDSRIQTATYNPHQVYRIKAAIGRAVLVQLEEDETLDDDNGLLGMGDSEAWKLSVKKNNILFKPLVAEPETNLIVNTNKRTYVFQLSVEPYANQANTYVLRFNYPDTAAKKRKAAEAQRKQVEYMLDGNYVNVERKNTNYWGYGDKAIKPTAMYDDGQFTYLEFNNNDELPTVFKVTADGSESLVNIHMRGHTVVVHELAKEFILRSGNQVLGIENRGFQGSGFFNRLGTDSPNAARILKAQDGGNNAE